MDDPKLYDTVDEAVEDGETKDTVASLSWRTDEEKDALITSAKRGNRQERRRGAYRTGGEREMPPLPLAKRNKRNATRRLAKKQRKINGG